MTLFVHNREQSVRVYCPIRVNNSWLLNRVLLTIEGEWISAGWNEGAKGTWHQKGQRLNEQLQDVLTPVTQHLLREAALAERRQSAARVLGSREFSIALFDQKELPHLLLDFCKL